jgi:hypothetical protein
MSESDHSPAAQHERFLQESRAIDEAFRVGTLRQWVEGKLNEYRPSNPDPNGTRAGEQVG